MFAAKYILIIEDDENLGNLIETALTIEGWGCIRSNKIGDSVLKLKNQKFDCILLDMNLASGGKGEVLLEQIRTNNALFNPDTPVIIVSGTLDDERIVKVYKRVSDILMKPFTVTALIEKINDATKD